MSSMTWWYASVEPRPKLVVSGIWSGPNGDVPIRISSCHWCMDCPNYRIAAGEQSGWATSVVVGRESYSLPRRVEGIAEVAADAAQILRQVCPRMAADDYPRTDLMLAAWNGTTRDWGISRRQFLGGEFSMAPMRDDERDCPGPDLWQRAREVMEGIVTRETAANAWTCKEMGLRGRWGSVAVMIHESGLRVAVTRNHQIFIESIGSWMTDKDLHAAMESVHIASDRAFRVYDAERGVYHREVPK